MRKLKSVKISLLAFVLVDLAAGCGREQTPSPAFPKVIATPPANGATLVLLNTAVTATFSSVMAPATINTTTFTLRYFFGRSFNTGFANSVARSFHASSISIPSGAASSDFRSPPARTYSSALILAAWARLTFVRNSSLFVATNMPPKP
jgi:hypothetical protein